MNEEKIKKFSDNSNLGDVFRHSVVAKVWIDYFECKSFVGSARW